MNINIYQYPISQLIRIILIIDLMKESFKSEAQIIETLRAMGFDDIKKKILQDVLILLQLQHLSTEKDQLLVRDQMAKRIQAIYAKYREHYMDYISHTNYQQLNRKAKQFIAKVLSMHHSKQLTKKIETYNANQQSVHRSSHSDLQSKLQVQSMARFNLSSNANQLMRNCNSNISFQLGTNLGSGIEFGNNAMGGVNHFYDASQSFLSSKNFNPPPIFCRNQPPKQNSYNMNYSSPVKPLNKFIPQYNSQLVPNLRNLNQMKMFQQKFFSLYKNFLPKFQDIINNSTPFNPVISNQRSSQWAFYETENYNQHPRKMNQFLKKQREHSYQNTNQNIYHSQHYKQPFAHGLINNQKPNITKNNLADQAMRLNGYSFLLPRQFQPNIQSQAQYKKSNLLDSDTHNYNPSSKPIPSLKKHNSLFQPFAVQDTASPFTYQHIFEKEKLQNQSIYPNLSFYRSNKNDTQGKYQMMSIQNSFNSSENQRIVMQNSKSQTIFNPTFVKCRCRGYQRMGSKHIFAIKQCKQCKHSFHLSCLTIQNSKQKDESSDQLLFCYQCQLFMIDPLNQVQSQILFEYLQQPWRKNHQIRLPMQEIKHFQNLNNHNIQIQMRCSMLSGNQIQIESINWPDNCLIKINGELFAQVKALPVTSNFKKRKDIPFDIKQTLFSIQDCQELKISIQPKILEDSQRNSFKINKKPYIFGVYITKMNSIQQLQAKIKQQIITKKMIQNIVLKKEYRIYEKQTDQINLTTESICFTLFDPFTKQVIQTPVKGMFCDHSNCFDLRAFLSIMNSASNLNRNWKCPFCGKLCTKFKINYDLRNVIQMIKAKNIQMPKQVTYFVEQGDFHYVNQNYQSKSKQKNETDKQKQQGQIKYQEMPKKQDQQLQKYQSQ